MSTQIPTHIYFFANGAVMAFGADGKQMPEWQRETAEQVDAMLKALTPEQRATIEIVRGCVWSNDHAWSEDQHQAS